MLIHIPMHLCTHHNFHTYTCHKHVHVQSAMSNLVQMLAWYRQQQQQQKFLYAYFCVCTTVKWYRCQHIHGGIIILKSENYHTHTCMLSYTHAHTHTYIYPHTHNCIYICTHTYTNTCSDTHMPMYICISIYSGAMHIGKYFS